jgi:hypothetical protein
MKEVLFFPLNFVQFSLIFFPSQFVKNGLIGEKIKKPIPLKKWVFSSPQSHFLTLYGLKKTYGGLN